MAAPNELKIVDFEVVNEPWNEYKLADGSTLRVKVVLVNVINEDGGFSFEAKNVIGVTPNPDFIGLPSGLLKPGETLESYVEEEDLKILEKTEYWNEYKLPSEKTRLTLKGVPVIVSRTSRRDPKGIPIYTANVQLLIKPKKEKN